MRPDRVEISWDAAKSSWLIRIITGEEVIRRHCHLPKNTDEPALRAAALKSAADEGYEADAAIVTVRH